MHGAPKSFEFFGSHATGNIERENNRQRPCFAASIFHVKESQTLFNPILKQFEIFLLERSHRAAFGVSHANVYRNQIRIDTHRVIGLLIFGWFNSAWSLGVRRILILTVARQQERAEKRNSEQAAC